jgi:hypothetical protein
MSYLCLTNYHAIKIYPVLMHYTMKMSEEVEVQLHAFLTLALETVSGKLHALATLPLGKESLVSTAEEVGFVPQPIWTWW